MPHSRNLIKIFFHLFEETYEARKTFFNYLKIIFGEWVWWKWWKPAHTKHRQQNFFGRYNLHQTSILQGDFCTCEWKGTKHYEYTRLYPYSGKKYNSTTFDKTNFTAFFFPASIRPRRLLFRHLYERKVITFLAFHIISRDN